MQSQTQKVKSRHCSVRAGNIGAAEEQNVDREPCARNESTHMGQQLFETDLRKRDMFQLLQISEFGALVTRNQEFKTNIEVKTHSH